MAIRYDLYKTPSPDGDKKRSKLHARVVNKGVVDTEELARKIEFSTSVTQGDVLSVISSLSYFVADELAEGKRIHIRGLGYFYITLENRPVNNPKEIRAESINVKTIRFQPEKDLKDKLKRATILRSDSG